MTNDDCFLSRPVSAWSWLLSLLDVANDAALICTLGVLKYFKRVVTGASKNSSGEIKHVCGRRQKWEWHSAETLFGCVVYQRLPQLVAVAGLYSLPQLYLPLFYWLQCWANLAYLIWLTAGTHAVLCWQCLTKQQITESSTWWQSL